MSPLPRQCAMDDAEYDAFELCPLPCRRVAQVLGPSPQRPGDPLQLVGGGLPPAGFELCQSRGPDAGGRGEGTLAQAAMLTPGADRTRAVEDGGR
jgi:hypothetical protein